MTPRTRMPYRRTQKPDPSEADFQAALIEYARWTGWHVAHHRPAQVGGRWVTAVTGDQGVPDLILARDGRVLLVELKTNVGRFGPGQEGWLTAAGDSGRCWRPADWTTIMEELR